MKIRVLAFGIARDIAGSGTFEIDLPDGADVGAAREHLLGAHPTLGRLASLLIAVNARYAGSDTILQPNDEIALIPPVSGG